MFTRRGFIISKLYEATRNELVSKSKSSAKGRERFNKRTKSSIRNTVKAMNSIDMNKLFKDDILTVGIPVHGETDDYTVTITFGGILELLRDQVERTGKLSFREISRACINGFNRDDVYISCTCEDFSYRFRYFATRNDFVTGAPETRPSNITNPKDTLGSGCKHILLVLNNNSWILRVARVIANYINYMEQHYQKLYATIIYPAIYGKEYEEPVQMDIEDTNELQTDTSTIDIINKERQQATRFQPGNTQGVRFAKETPDSNPRQMKLTNDDDVV